MVDEILKVLSLIAVLTNTHTNWPICGCNLPEVDAVSFGLRGFDTVLPHVDK